MVVVIVVLALLEGALRISDYGGDHTGLAQPHYRLAGNASGKDVYATDPDKLTFLNYQEFPVIKEPGTFRIFCFGGSSTYGRPYGWETAFPRWLELILNSSGSRYRFEVVNAGGISYAIYRVAGLIEEVLESGYLPDLLVVYTGHNEFLERRPCDVPHLQGRVRVFLDHLKLTALLQAAFYAFSPRPDPVSTRSIMDTEVDAILDRTAGLDYYVRDDTRRLDVLGHYEQNLERIVKMAQSHSIPLVLVNTVSNLRDFSPFKSSHVEGLKPADEVRWDSLWALGCERAEAGEIGGAIDVFREAAEIDGRHAGLQFRIASCFDAAGEAVLAESCYSLARDEDVCPLRAPGEINAAIRRVCEKHQVPLVDLRSCLRKLAHRRTGSQILGNGFFLDHVHLTIEGNQIMALEIAEKLAHERLVAIASVPDGSSLRTAFSEVEASLDTEYMARMHLNLGKVLSWAGKKDEAAHHFAQSAHMASGNAETYYRVGKTHRDAGRVEQALIEFRKALAVRPDYAAAHNDLGLCYLDLGRVKDAEDCFRKAMELRPDQPMPHIGLGRCYASRGLLDQAGIAYEKAVALQPDYADGLNNLGLVYREAGRFEDAEIAFKRALALYPDFAEARNNLGLLYLGTGRRDMAEAEFRAAARSKPHLYQTYGNLGLVLLLRGDRAGAAVMFNKVLELNPGDEDAIRLLAGIE
ncbi:MAG: tetratricopeptide repeat protein [Candidatus Eisenbacteria bacterium]